MSRPILAVIKQRALSHNLAVVRKLAPSANIWSVVKANAYGHGLARCYSSLSKTDGFALLNYEEAVLLRDAGVKQPILLLEGFFKTADLALIEHYQLTTAVHSQWQVEALANYQGKKAISVYLKVNSGMNRLGFPPAQIPALYRRLSSLSAVSRVTVMAHFAQADEGAEQLAEPLRRIQSAVQGLDCPLSLANSAATLWHPATHQQWVRPGIILYGASPTGNQQDIADVDLQPVMQLNSEIIAIQQVAQAEGVGYGHHYITDRPRRIGIVACGYADGYPRHAPTGTPLMVEGQRTGTLGTVSMDMMMVDLTPCPQAQIGTKVQLWGDQIAVDEVAQAAGTVGYELLTAVTQRVPFILD